MNNYCPIQNSKCGGPSYNPDKWELSVEDHEINNCYSYALNIMETDIIERRQPGKKCNLEFEYDCKNIEKMMQCDFPSITKLDNIDTEIPCDHYRIALVLDKKGNILRLSFL